MICKHKKTGELYKVLFESFSVERQAASVVYVQINTGYVFDRDAEKFNSNFEILDYSPQEQIEPREDPNQRKLKL